VLYIGGKRPCLVKIQLSYFDDGIARLYLDHKNFRCLCQANLAFVRSEMKRTSWSG